LKELDKKILTLPLRLALILLIIGALFKIMHWPYSSILMFIAGVSLTVLYTIRFLNKKTKSRLDYIKLALVLLWLISYFLKVFHLFKHRYILDIGVAILFIYWFLNDNPNYLMKRKFKKKGVVKVIYQILKVFTILSLIFGVLFKIQHWPYGSILFTQGILFLCILLILDYFIKERS
jgi:hypothetical protein